MNSIIEFLLKDKNLSNKFKEILKKSIGDYKWN